MTGDGSTPENPGDSYYIPPAAGAGAKEAKKPEKPGEDWSGLAVIVLGAIVLFAGFQLFIVVMQLINTWIAAELVPVFTAAFDLAIIIACLWLIRKYVQKK